MVADNELDELISIIAGAVAVLLEEQENGGKVSNLLDKEEFPSIGYHKEVTNERFDKFNYRSCCLTDGRQQ